MINKHQRNCGFSPELFETKSFSHSLRNAIVPLPISTQPESNRKHLKSPELPFPELDLSLPKLPITATPTSDESNTIVLPNQKTVDIADSISELISRYDLHCLRQDKLTYRQYQIKTVSAVFETWQNCIIESETASGKTVMALMLSAKVLDAGKKVFFISPTVELTQQIAESAFHFLKLQDDQLSIVSGSIDPNKRAKLYPNGNIRFVVATAETIRNDLKTGRIPAEYLSQLGLVFFDEVHHNRGNSAYAELSRLLKAYPEIMLAGLSAQPVEHPDEIPELMKRMGAKHYFAIPSTSQAIQEQVEFVSLEKDSACMKAWHNLLQAAHNISCDIFEALSSFPDIQQQFLAATGATRCGYFNLASRKHRAEIRKVVEQRLNSISGDLIDSIKELHKASDAVVNSALNPEWLTYLKIPDLIQELRRNYKTTNDELIYRHGFLRNWHQTFTQTVEECKNRFQTDLQRNIYHLLINTKDCIQTTLDHYNQLSNTFTALSNLATLGLTEHFINALTVFGKFYFLDEIAERLWDHIFKPANDIPRFQRTLLKHKNILLAFDEIATSLQSSYVLLRTANSIEELGKSLFDSNHHKQKVWQIASPSLRRELYLKHCRQELIELNYWDSPKELRLVQRISEYLAGPTDKIGLVVVDRAKQACFLAERLRRRLPEFSPVVILGKQHQQGDDNNINQINIGTIRSGRSKLAIGTSVMEEGWDFAQLDVVFALSPSPESKRVKQQRGRAGRTKGSKGHYIQFVAMGTSDVASHHAARARLRKNVSSYSNRFKK